jgi:hypothetical protein
MIKTYNGRTIEIIEPKNRHGACAYTVNGIGRSSGERFTGGLGESAADLLAGLTRHFDQIDAQGPAGIKGHPDWVWALVPGSFERCPAPGLNAHIKPVGHPCNEDTCKKAAAKEARRKALAAEQHPAVAALTAQLRRAGFPLAPKNSKKESGFRVVRGDLGEVRKSVRRGVTVLWYEKGHVMPLPQHPGRCQEIADFLAQKDKFAVHYDGGARIRVLSKTHGERA